MTDDMSETRSQGTVLPEDDLETRSITWPTVLGTISIIYAVFGVFANGCGIGSVFLGDFGLRLAGIEVDGGLSLPTWMTASTVILGGFGLVLCGMLFLGAAGLIRRRPGSVGLLKIWVVGAIVAAVIQVVLGFLSINNSIDLSIRIQDATAEMVRKQNPKISGEDLAAMGLAKTPEDIRTQTMWNTVIWGGLPVIYPLVLGFLLTSKSRVRQVEGWDR